MRNKMHLLAATACAAAVVVTWSGCSTQSYEEGRPRIYGEQEYNTLDTAGRAGRTDVPRYTQREEAPPAPAPAPAPVATPRAKPTSCGVNEFTLKSDLLQLVKRVPAEATLGQTVENDIVVTPLADCANVAITDTVPDNATYVKSEPAAQVNGKKLTWTMDTLDKGSPVTIKVWLKPDHEGCLVTCATMTAIPRGCAATLIGVAKLAISCSMPAAANVGAQLNKVIEVRNTGSAVAKNVVITDTLPAGLSAAGATTFTIGDLAPGQAKQVTVPLKAAARGLQTNSATAESANAGEAKTECATMVNQPGLAISKDGTKQQFLGRNATYNIVVSNTGDTDLQNVVVTDKAPAETKIVSAEGASVSGNTAAWTLASLAKGAKQSLGIVLTSGTAGEHCNVVGVKSAEGLTADAQACTLWKGVPAILLETRDDPDPVSIGDTVTYTIRVTNQGTANDTNIKVVAHFAKEVDPISASNGVVDGKTVTFTTVPVLGPKQVVTYTITAKGVAAGDHRLKVDLTSDMLTEPVTHEESTHVY